MQEAQVEGHMVAVTLPHEKFFFRACPHCGNILDIQEKVIYLISYINISYVCLLDLSYIQKIDSIEYIYTLI